ncbi:MAG TPA: tRNA (adenosine(37)-N6)-threonylcarbamoyltransferase complex transferase subunit TsaD [Fimbriimonadaceae bacterium]|nr:tRNA (adenosine(37)-N6)-threonylcarbamoyltransferase complex transferase subunit TsaD [Armatimonadota bacterium]HRD31611.1 tRNA (adenosine(37)-N6)-threonylcarbamoyltransferase complex transferase subunit TsaD [Fimbriimonadaceae bacterium]HRE93343.1 tRNA (adenosine(37)-N6)-threonylcarbamoyltransferase complex transferase subunit TsaD [Fimbriimonadaceae bacterium]HRI73660.1 tRNA (adenosine(37)-N6)-threonylcarbamoyltransferase complex transferase subunit TsaD [Fimbriimonadaceae bacterium]
MRVLGIETSCDETAAAWLVDGAVVRNVISSQVALHAQWGGIVPEAAARAHVEAILPVLSEAMGEDGPPDGIAVTNRPGLVGALSVGVSAAKALATLWRVPLVGVHHIEGHILSPFAAGEPQPPFPHLCLVVSGGHTELVRVDAPGQYRILAETVDDAAGEAFDKGARLLGLGYPGGRALQELARDGDAKRYALPRALPGDGAKFSFSGLKTAMRLLVDREGETLNRADAAASLQAAIVDALVRKALRALDEEGLKAMTLVGGVAANESLRETLRAACNRVGAEFFTPPFDRCTDNAAMIAIAGSFRLARGMADDLSLDVMPNADLPAY